ncbi:MAG: hypothetical protein RMX26_01650, partial [Planktomarina sp.]|nr:hypothetical protein [Planktomarina sp.]
MIFWRAFDPYAKWRVVVSTGAKICGRRLLETVEHLYPNLLISFRPDLSLVEHYAIDLIDFFSDLVDPSGIEPLTSCMPCRR